MRKNVFIVAGEASGDHHAAQLVKQMVKQDNKIAFTGIGGQEMRSAGVNILVDSATIAVMGLFEVLAQFRTVYAALRLARKQLHDNPPDILILIDYPDFNLRLAKTAKKLGIKVLYYISPKVWASRKKRINKIRKVVDMMAVIFPFEKAIFENAGIPVEFVGNPLVNEVNSQLSPYAAKVSFNLNPDRPVLGLFPGSRKSEIKRLMPVMLEAAELIRNTIPEIQFVLPLASTISEADIRHHMKNHELDIHITSGRNYDLMKSCDAIISASGTATLEIALMQIPLIVTYKISPLSYAILSRLLTIEHVALCNIVPNDRVCPELLQHDATAENLSREALLLLQDESLSEKMKDKQGGIRKLLGEDNKHPAINTAELAFRLML